MREAASVLARAKATSEASMKLLRKRKKSKKQELPRCPRLSHTRSSHMKLWTFSTSPSFLAASCSVSGCRLRSTGFSDFASLTHLPALFALGIETLFFEPLVSGSVRCLDVASDVQENGLPLETTWCPLYLAITLGSVSHKEYRKNGLPLETTSCSLYPAITLGSVSHKEYRKIGLPLETTWCPCIRQSLLGLFRTRSTGKLDCLWR